MNTVVLYFCLQASASSAPSSAAPAAAKPLRGGAAPAAERPTPALTLTIKKVYLNQIFERRKRVEGRVHAGGLAKLRVGECVALRDRNESKSGLASLIFFSARLFGEKITELCHFPEF